MRTTPTPVRAPDVAFIRAGRVPLIQRRRGYFDGPPDLAVEVVSFNDRKKDVTAKAEQWLAAGATSVWVVDPATQTIDVYRRGQFVHLGRGDTLRDEPALPGFVLNVADVFAADV